ncbi:MAG: flagellar biosynthesis anti-sigma factor FlgM [bacterium]|nr:flagellar biosynthesis anti-sigma factor FlgM [bacterium]
MVINRIEGIFPNRDNIEPVKRKKETEPAKKADDVQISNEARERQSIQKIFEKAKNYIKNLPDIREEKVESASNIIRDQYKLDPDKLSNIADKLLDKDYI